MSDAVRKKLNLKACRLIKSQGIRICFCDDSGCYGKFDNLRRMGFPGLAGYYVQGSYDESELENKADITIYKQLLEIDSQLGTTQTEQLFWCVFHSVRMDLIKV